MAQPEHYSFSRYLEAKRTVDDRALSRRCWERLLEELKSFSPNQPLQVLEVGAGVGTMVERLVEWGLHRDLNYTAVDVDSSLLARAAVRLPIWAESRGWQAKRAQQDRLILAGDRQEISLEFIATDIFHLAKQPGRSWDLLIAHAFMDLVDLDTTLPTLLSCLHAGGLFYFTLVFDGGTILRPTVDPDFDARVEACYHRCMNERVLQGRPAGHSQTGRILLETLWLQGTAILAAHSSDWVVYPPYPADEAYFLHHILHLMEDGLRGCPELEVHQLEQWLTTRHRHIEEGRLFYIAHQLDVLGRP